MNDLYLNGIPDLFHERARAALEAGNAVGFLCLADNTLGLDLVEMNRQALVERGIYEAALLHALTATRLNFHYVPRARIAWLLHSADREKLRAAGEPLAGEGPFQLYRGVAGRGPARRVRGLHWTGSFQQAQWFACRFDWLDAPSVFEATVPASAILAYILDRDEDEYLVNLPGSVRPKRVWTRACPAQQSGLDGYEISRGLTHSQLGITERYLARGGGDVVNGEI